MNGSSTRWLSNWMMVPILRLGYRPETFLRPPPTRRAGLQDRVIATVARAVSFNPRRMHQLRNSVSLSTFPPTSERQQCCSLPPLVRAALILPRQRIPASGFRHELLKLATVPDRLFQFLSQLLGHIDGKPVISVSAIQRVAGVSFA